jgi:hypothetical protein
VPPRRRGGTGSAGHKGRPGRKSGHSGRPSRGSGRRTRPSGRESGRVSDRGSRPANRRPGTGSGGRWSGARPPTRPPPSSGPARRCRPPRDFDRGDRGPDPLCDAEFEVDRGGGGIGPGLGAHRGVDKAFGLEGGLEPRAGLIEGLQPEDLPDAPPERKPGDRTGDGGPNRDGPCDRLPQAQVSADIRTGDLGREPRIETRGKKVPDPSGQRDPAVPACRCQLADLRIVAVERGVEAQGVERQADPPARSEPAVSVRSSTAWISPPVQRIWTTRPAWSR